MHFLLAAFLTFTASLSVGNSAIGTASGISEPQVNGPGAAGPHSHGTDYSPDMGRWWDRKL